MLASADYTARIGELRGVDELTTLGRTFDFMAQAINDDIGRRHIVQKELEVARKQAEDATHAKSMFLASMSHEIRTPMNAILGMAYLTLKTDLTARQQDYVGKIHDAARSLVGVINDIPDFLKVEAASSNSKWGDSASRMSQAIRSHCFDNALMKKTLNCCSMWSSRNCLEKAVRSWVTDCVSVKFSLIFCRTP